MEIGNSKTGARSLTVCEGVSAVRKKDIEAGKFPHCM